MGIFDRLSTLFKANINDLINSAENPEKMLNQIIVDMRTQLAKAKQQVATAIADERRLRDQADAELRASQDWEQKAMLAINAGRDDMARQALLRQSEHAEHAAQLEATWQTHRAETEKLKNSLRDLNDKIEEAKRKKNLLLARQRRAEAQKRIAQTMSSLDEKSAFEAFARMEEKIEANERQLAAAQQIDEEFTGDRLSQDFKQLERASVGLSAEDKLLQLKQRMGMLPAGAPAASRQLGAGSAPAAAPADAAARTLSAGAGSAPPPAPNGAPPKQTTEEELLAEFEELAQEKPKA
jgi:phage shock protein A